MRLPLILAVIAGLAHAALAKPTLWIIGDSTVRNGTRGQCGWGDPLVAEFDPASIEVVNRAIGGRSSRTFLTEGRWDAVLANLRPGDYLLIQFGHNDGGEFFKGDRPRASIKSNGDETESGTVEASGKEETVRSFGWYLRKYCSEAIEKGATPIVVSLIPRNLRDPAGHIIRSDVSYALWARQAAGQVGARFIDFNALLAARYDAIGREATDALFAGTDHTHTNHAGATFNARALAEAIRSLPDCGLSDHFRPAGLWLPHVFSDHLVLQRRSEVPVWGRTTPSTEVRVTLGETSASTTSDASGAFLVKLPALEAGGPHTLDVSTTDHSRRFTDVMVGEVWLCSGQSNMDFTVAPTEKRPFAGTLDWRNEMAAANQHAIRSFTADWTPREDPQPEVGGTWRIASPETVGDFSAVAWFFAREIHRELGVPIGLITSAYGASTAEAWISREKLASHSDLEPLLTAYNAKMLRFRDDLKSFANHGVSLAAWERSGVGRPPRSPDPVQDQHNPTVLFNGMIAPIIPYGIRGALWYQGESNVGTRKLYPALQQSLIEDWRTRWNQGDFPFYLVQLAPHHEPKPDPADSSLASMREAQAAALSLPNTGMAVTLGIGDAKDVHPRDKQQVGHRLARIALAQTYGRDLVPTGPVLETATVEDAHIRLTFSRVADGLVAKDGPLNHFAIAGSDRNFVWADARIDGDSVIVSSPGIKSPAFVRYAWADNPEGSNLFNSEDLPAAPFRTDH